jgi:GGDEF domain-containing protein
VQPISPSTVSQVAESLRSCETEEELLSSACAIPQEAVSREALVIITTADRGVGQGAYYSVSRESRFNHRLLELVCKHKKIICPDRSVHVTSSDDLEQRSFLSVPFRVLGKEAGSFNVLSRQDQAFQAGEIAVLEKLAAITGERLEHIRLKDSLGNRTGQPSLLSWRQFEAKAGLLLDEAACQKQNLALVRIVLRGLSDIEDIAGVDTACRVTEKTSRIIEQIAGAESASCCLYGAQFLILCEQSDALSIQRKLNTLLDRIDIGIENNRRLPDGLKLNQLLRQSTTTNLARFPQDGTSLADLIARTNTAHTNSSWQQKSLEVTANAGSWTE